MARKPQAPSDLSARAKRVWTRTLDHYELREDELSILADYCHELSLVDRLQEASVNAEILIKASHGGTQANPIFTELRMHRQAAIALWKALKLPDLESSDDEDQDDDRVVPMSREDSARKAANARWAKR